MVDLPDLHLPVLGGTSDPHGVHFQHVAGDVLGRLSGGVSDLDAEVVLGCPQASVIF